ncbi:hypothetical protein [Collimonas antrihumi]|uniref:hypothetical protein n=1 Tax=Collimonas antrihumi TaxID=1940615 RepID=UPI001B8D98AE|nr:hypothetical protein [Collimonas antrihumi]
MRNLFDRRIASEIRLISCVLMVALTALVYLYQRAFLPSYFFTDEATILNLMRYSDLDSLTQNSFVSTATVFSLLGPAGSQLLLLASTCMVIFYVGRKSLRLADLAFACVLMLPFVMFNLKLSKETVVILMNLLACLVCSWRISNHRKVLLVSAIYLIYAWQFRSYYVLIVATMIVMHIVFSTQGKLRVAIVLAVLAGCLALPGDFWNQLQQARDIVNLDRDGLSDSKTIFSNPFSPNGIATALPNAGFAALRFYFAPIYSLRVQEIFLSFTLFLLTFVLFRRHNIKHPLALLLIANFSIQTFFEPDLGSFFRHLSAYAFCVFGIHYLQPVPVRREKLRRTVAAFGSSNLYRKT